MGDQAHTLQPRFSLFKRNGREVHKDCETCTENSNADWHWPTSCAVVAEKHTGDRTEHVTCRNVNGKSPVKHTSLLQCCAETVHTKACPRQNTGSAVSPKTALQQHAKPLPLLSPGDTVHRHVEVGSLHLSSSREMNHAPTLCRHQQVRRSGGTDDIWGRYTWDCWGTLILMNRLTQRRHLLRHLSQTHHQMTHNTTHLPQAWTMILHATLDLVRQWDNLPGTGTDPVKASWNFCRCF